MEPLFLSFLLLFTLTSAQSINNVASNANSPISYSSYPPGYENENEIQNSPSQSANSDISFPPSDSPLPTPSETESSSSSFEPSEFSSISTESISSSGQAGASGFSSSLMSINTRNNEGESNDHDITSIKKICDNTDYPDLCTTTVAPFLHGNVVNVQQILEVAMKASDQFAKLGFAAVKRASESPATPPKTKKMLKTCLDSWDTVLYNYEQAIEALRIHGSGRMSTMLSAAITDISDCQDAFEGVVSPLIGYGEKMTKMTSNCLAIVSQLAS
ncbi:pectinesterase inhibitor 3-like [Lycium barbarum]|uniref:pectinesterase inhibitor 3-like n=1 Tax=Lycium barbarum TaxID=112863 RepID=UPI00293E476B|nr:pectinesterase inhibitor 3-like [Lycium barbarum]